MESYQDRRRAGQRAGGSIVCGTLRTGAPGDAPSVMCSQVLAPVLDLQSAALRRVFQALDREGTGVVDAVQAKATLGMACRGTTRDKLDLLFKTFDRECTGFIRRIDAREMLEELLMDRDLLSECLDGIFGQLQQLTSQQFCRGMVRVVPGHVSLSFR